ncbi:hypothetical protein TRVL_03769 [Trypanosoma vivax]|uniref:Uncharacterized protein n=1 Tax=Trypanosoma vivax (strain Y486) TaxID=1055687 RepID=G0U9I5_TRYVY|nr:hypothetical protein TRVL_03769 [Trypanosoma vivax]CCC54271.1 hypothetical protein TVY486_1117550 [Trypanosoma vivax Y486]
MHCTFGLNVHMTFAFTQSVPLLGIFLFLQQTGHTLIPPLCWIGGMSFPSPLFGPISPPAPELRFSPLLYRACQQRWKWPLNLEGTARFMDNVQHDPVVGSLSYVLQDVYVRTP